MWSEVLLYFNPYLATLKWIYKNMENGDKK